MDNIEEERTDDPRQNGDRQLFLVHVVEVSRSPGTAQGAALEASGLLYLTDATTGAGADGNEGAY